MLSAVVTHSEDNSKIGTISARKSYPSQAIENVGFTTEVFKSINKYPNSSESSESDWGSTVCISPWQYSAGNSCKCGNIPHLFLSVNHDLTGNVSVLASYCVTYNKEDDTTEFGPCLYTNDLVVNLPSNKLKLNDFMCGSGYNRNSTLCGKCKENFHPLVNSFDIFCVECQNGKSNRWKFIVAVFLPLTLFYFTVLFLKINVTSSHMHGFVFYSQTITYPQLTRALFSKSPLLKELYCKVYR